MERWNATLSQRIPRRRNGPYAGHDVALDPERSVTRVPAERRPIFAIGMALAAATFVLLCLNGVHAFSVVGPLGFYAIPVLVSLVGAYVFHRRHQPTAASILLPPVFVLGGFYAFGLLGSLGFFFTSDEAIAKAMAAMRDSGTWNRAWRYPPRDPATMRGMAIVGKLLATAIFTVPLFIFGCLGSLVGRSLAVR